MTENNETTTRRFKDFGTGSQRDAGAEPPVFKIHDEEFTCVPQIQGKFLLDIVKMSSNADAGDTARMISDFFEGVLEDESYARFSALLVDKHRVVSVETLSEIVGWLIEEYANRPE